MKVEIHGIKFGLRVKQAIRPEAEDACKHITPAICPDTQGGELLTLKWVHPLDSFYFESNVIVEFAIVGDDTKNHICARFEAILKKK